MCALVRKQAYRAQPNEALLGTKLDIAITTRSFFKRSGPEAGDHPAPIGAYPWSGPGPDAINP